jgi:hypothetical protein
VTAESKEPVGSEGSDEVKPTDYRPPEKEGDDGDEVKGFNDADSINDSGATEGGS